MDRRTAEAALIAVLAVVALAAAAATLPSATSTGGGSGTGLPSEGGGDGGLVPPPARTTTPVIDLSFLQPLFLALLVVAVIAGLVYAFLYRREALQIVLGFVVLVALFALLFWLVSLLDLSGAGGAGFDGLPFGDPGGGDGDDAPASPPYVLLVFVGILLLGAVAVLVRAGSSSPGEAAPAGHPGSEEARAVGRAAGRAADRIESAGDLDNEIFRAWREMTALLEVDRPESTSPGEFAAAARGAGMAPDDVGELTRLFEDVRYGGDEPTAAKERRALAILRRVEETYVPSDGADG